MRVFKAVYSRIIMHKHILVAVWPEPHILDKITEIHLYLLSFCEIYTFPIRLCYNLFIKKSEA